MKIPIQLLLEYLKKILINNGLSKVDSRIVADVLVAASMKGDDDHGINALLPLLEEIKHNSISPTAKARLIRQNDAIAVIDAFRCVGHPIAKKAMKIAIKKANRHGVGVCGVINGGHIGALSYYSELASSCGCLGLVICTSAPISVIAGGKIKTFGTNPISYSFPSNSIPVTADFATSKISRTTLRRYLRQNIYLPNGVAVDCHGDGTVDPKEAWAGGLQTIDGGIKSSLISLLISVIAGPLVGSPINPEITSAMNSKITSNKGDLLIALNIESFGSLNNFKASIDKLRDFIDNQLVEFRTPGEYSQLCRAQILKEGIEIPRQLLQLFIEYDIINYDNITGHE